MKPGLRALIVDDSPDDAELIVRELTRGGYDVTSLRVDTADALQRALEDDGWQVVLCDFSMPGFSGEMALSIVRANARDLPLIFVSGTIGEECAVSAMKAGADDYVMKDRLARLVPAVAREVREADERNEAQEALRLSRQAYASLVSSIEGIVWEADADTLRFQFVSQQAERLLGYPAERWLREPTFWQDHLHPEDRTWAVEYCLHRARRREDHAFTYRMLAADGRIVWLHDLVTVATGSTGRVVLRGIMVDVTDAKRAEEALRASEQRFRQVTETIDEVFWLFDIEKHALAYVSPAYERVWGRSIDTLVAEPRSWIDAIHLEDRERVFAALPLLTLGQYDIEYRIIRPDGAERWVHDRAFPIKGPNGEVYRLAGVAEDITDRRVLEEQLRQSQKMEAIGRLAGGVAHDFNNLLAVIQMQASLLVTAPPSNASDVQEGLQEILAAAERAANLTRQLLTFSRRDVTQARPIDLADITGGMTKLLRRILGEDLSLETRLAQALPLVNADPGMMEQVLLNLAINARDAMPRGGQLVLSLDAVEISPSDASQRKHARPGRFVRLLVKDTGCGIPQAEIPRIFEPFYTTKEEGRGTGLGLATVFGIIERHDGWIEVTSEVGRGTTFDIFLPALPVSQTAARDNAATPGIVRGTESILLVEDDPSVRALARVSLEFCGYRVHEADSGRAALALWERLTEPVDLLLTDLIMPGGISGRELAERLTARQPDLKVLYSSGYSDDVVFREQRLTPGYNFLQKPYHVADMAATVRRCLDGR